MYTLVATTTFTAKTHRLTQGNKTLQKQLQKTLILLQTDPYYPGLKTHKVAGYRSSRVSGDIRIIWEFDPNGRVTILLLTIGEHSGADKVY